MRFIDLFAGLGGFHVALADLGHKCVLASEIDPTLQDLYEKNFGIRPHGDIRRIPTQRIPRHEILCAGFPCQPFSKAGDQAGLECPNWGDLFDQVIKILRNCGTQYFILENVPNLERHDEGATWAHMRAELSRLGYDFHYRVLSPHQFGVPQIRERLFVVGSRHGLAEFAWPSAIKRPLTIDSILDSQPAEARALSLQAEQCLQAWQEFLHRCPKTVELPSFPIWSMEFGADYPFEDCTPYQLGTRLLTKYKGAHGVPLREFPPDVRMGALPSYARSASKRFPNWKVQFIRQNRKFFADNKQWIKPWIKRILEFPPSLQKLEWNCKGEVRDIWRYVLQFRASGVRVKRRTTAPSLVAMTTTQVPIVAWEHRYMTPRECARLQSLDKLKLLPIAATSAYKALGNAVNAKIVGLIGERLLARKALTKRNGQVTSIVDLVA